MVRTSDMVMEAASTGFFNNPDFPDKHLFILTVGRACST
jgi:hypothetical protein